jgi:hypothetical protein
MPVLFAAGRSASTLGGINVDEQFTVFGAYGPSGRLRLRPSRSLVAGWRSTGIASWSEDERRGSALSLNSCR